jgi:hypothetical protein
MESDSDDAAEPPSVPLRHVLFGSPFCERVAGKPDPAARELDRLLGDLIDLLRAEHGADSVAFGQAEREITTVKNFDLDERGVICKRACVLYAIWRDPAISARFEATEPELLSHLSHVLPIVGARYLAELGQRPDSFVYACAVLTGLWEGQVLCLPASSVSRSADAQGTVLAGRSQL